MAIFSGEIRSSILGMDTGLSVVLPYDRPADNQQTPCKVLYLLHGLGESSTAWTRYTNIERYAREYGIAVIMPAVQKSFYANMEYGPNYFDYITQELPQIISSMFKVSDEPKDTYIAGLSMGGYGALKCGFTYPKKYGGLASFSGAVDLKSVKVMVQTKGEIKEFRGVFGNELEIKPEDDLFKLAENYKEDLPVYISCGTEDYLYNDNINFKQHLEKLNISHKFEQWPGKHEWNFWDHSIQKALKFLIA